MLSNTAEMKPRLSEDSHEAGGNFSTGIIEAQVTRVSRKIVPLTVSGRISQSGRPSAPVAIIATTTAGPITGIWSSRAGNLRFATTLAAIATTRMTNTIETRVHSI